MQQESSAGASPGKASEWLVALAESPGDAALRARFEQWLAASPHHARDWSEINRTYHALGRLPAPAVRSRRWLLAAGAVAAAACLTVLFGPRPGTESTGAAERREIRLADGSLIRLAPDSAVSIDYDDRSRRVRLVKGDAFFQVAHEASRPFAVRAGEVEATDLGTAFEVKTGPDETEVAVREGLVDVGSRRLSAGEWVHVAATGEVSSGAVDPQEIAAWMDGQLIVRNQPVADVVAALRPYFAGVIVLKGGSLGRQPVTGVYNLADPVAALRALAQAEGGKVRRFSPWLLVISDS